MMTKKGKAEKVAEPTQDKIAVALQKAGYTKRDIYKQKDYGDHWVIVTNDARRIVVAK